MQIKLETPEAIQHQIWKELGRATQDRHHPWRTPVIATACPEGAVNARTVVLRAADAQRQQLRIYTDARSPKVAELVQQPQAMFVFWSARLGWQLRVRVTVSVQTSGAEVDALWDRVKPSASASDYLSPWTPGTALQADGVLPSTAHTQHTQVTNFAVLTADVRDMDWLELASTGHRRAKMDGSGWTWLVP